MSRWRCLRDQGGGVGESERESVGESERESVGASERESVGASERESVRALERESVRALERESVRALERESVGASSASLPSRFNASTLGRFNGSAGCINSQASQSSSSGCEGGSPCLPNSSTVSTMPRPKYCSQRRFTITLAVSGLLVST